MKRAYPLTIAIDFDGTVVTHEFPNVGKDIGAVPVLKRLVEEGHKLILFTMRDGIYLQEAKAWFNKYKITLYGVQYNPTQANWTSSNKCFANLYIDDAALGAPLIFPEDGTRPYIDWAQVEEYLIQNNIL